MKKTGQRRGKKTPTMPRGWRAAVNDFHVRVFGEEMARVNRLPLAARRRYIGEMVDHSIQNGARSAKPASGVTP